MRLFTRNGHDWTDRFQRITEAALRDRVRRFVLDGEAVLLRDDGRGDFISRRHKAEVQFYAFHEPALDRVDYDPCRCTFERAISRGCCIDRWTGLFLSEFERGGIDPNLPPRLLAGA